MTYSARDSDEADYAAELHPNVAAVASVYGDPQGTYLAYLKAGDPNFASNPYFLWNQPFAPNEGGTVSTQRPSPSKPKATAKSTSELDNDSAAVSLGAQAWISLASIVVGIACTFL